MAIREFGAAGPDLPPDFAHKDDFDRLSPSCSSELVQWSIRSVDVKPGGRGWLKGDHNHTPARTLVEVISRDASGVCLVRLPGGREKRVFAHHIDCGLEYKTRKGCWIPESDPRVRDWLRRAIRDIREGGGRVCAADDFLARADTLREFEWRLRRNGWESE